MNVLSVFIYNSKLVVGALPEGQQGINQVDRDNIYDGSDGRLGR